MIFKQPTAKQYLSYCNYNSLTFVESMADNGVAICQLPFGDETVGVT